MKIKSIMVVGGGSSGWMTAAALCKKFGKDIKVSVLEGKNSNPVGVGESTITKFNVYLNQILEIEDKEWMSECNATYKTSIRFTNFEMETEKYLSTHLVDIIQKNLLEDGLLFVPDTI